MIFDHDLCTGCPCPQYECQTTTTLVTSTSSTTTTTTAKTKDWVLVLSSKPPMIIDGNGQSKDIEFEYGSETQMSGSCSIIWRGTMYVFGSSKEKRQISKVDQCQLKRVGNLPFNVYQGGCANQGDSRIYLCFYNYNDAATWATCKYSSSPTGSFSTVSRNSYYEHALTKIAATTGEPYTRFCLKT